MQPETEAAALHRALRDLLPGRAPALLGAAGQGVAAYILAHRIPRPAQRLLRALPAALAAPLLARAIAAHAWTFAGSGRLRIAAWRPPVFEIAGNPLVAGEVSAAPLCHWHRAVLAGLFGALVWPRAEVHETACRACGDGCCRFEVAPGA